MREIVPCDARAGLGRRTEGRRASRLEKRLRSDPGPLTTTALDA